jgi:hypothetical protein
MVGKLRLSEWANLAEIIGTIAIVASLAYVGLEVHQNTKALQTESYKSVLEMISEGENILATDVELHRIYVTGTRSPESLSEEDWSRFTYFNFPRMGIWEYLYLGKLDNTITPATWSAFDPYFRDLSCMKGNRRFFEENRVGHASLFMDYLDSGVFPHCPPQ